MHIEYHKWWSHNLNRDMEYKVYGHDGQALLAFPCQDGRYFDWENYQMIDVLAPFIEAGRLRVICVDGIDIETWSNKTYWDKHARIEHHESWFRYVVDELLPNVRHNPEQMFITTGASMGGFHAANFFFRRPDLFNGVLALSGLYHASYGFDDYKDQLVYDNSPQDFLQNMDENHPWMQMYRQRKIVFCVGQGRWEDELLWSTREMDRILSEKHVPHWFDYWGTDTDHDWPFWRKQIPYFIEKILCWQI